MIHGHQIALFKPLQLRLQALPLYLTWRLFSVCGHEDTCGKASPDDLEHAVDEAIVEDTSTSAEHGVRCRDAEGDCWVEGTTRHGTNGITAGCDARANGKTEVLTKWGLHSGHREHNEGEQECKHDLGNCCLGPAVALTWCQWERLATLHGSIGASSGDSGNDLDSNVDAGVLWRALVAA